MLICEGLYVKSFSKIEVTNNVRLSVWIVTTPNYWTDLDETPYGGRHSVFRAILMLKVYSILRNTLVKGLN
jgi:hypothetical protein